MTRIRIDLSEQFPNLPSAPIVEAVIHWRARSGKELDGDVLKGKLLDYPQMKPLHEVRVEAASSLQVELNRGQGFRFETEDGRYVAQFTRNGFVFSRLAPYEHWERFVLEAKRLWQIYVEQAEPPEIQRLGVRFINRIVPVKLDELGDYLEVPPRCPDSLGLPINEFLHRNTFNVRGYPYTLNVNQTIQPLATGQGDELGLILDIDVFTDSAIAIEGDEGVLDERLAQMRWLKNKAFSPSPHPTRLICSRRRAMSNAALIVGISEEAQQMAKVTSDDQPCTNQ